MLDMNYIYRGFYFIGATTTAFFLFKVACKIFNAIKVYGFKSYPNFSNYGRWSVVTGSTEGIGKSIAYELASRGQNILLISRNLKKLENVSTDISLKYGVETRVLQIDFRDDELIYKNIADKLKGLDIGVLINNVGTMGSLPEYYHNTPDLSEVIRNITRVNITSTLKMIECVLPGMVERKRGLIINVSALIARVPVATFACYGASKCFIDYFSQALSYEYEDKGITIQSLLPGPVSTAGTNNPPPNFMLPSSEDFAKSLLSTVGKERSTFGCWSHSLQFWILRHIPLGFFNRKVAPKMREEMMKSAKKG